MLSSVVVFYRKEMNRQKSPKMHGLAYYLKSLNHVPKIWTSNLRVNSKNFKEIQYFQSLCFPKIIR